MKGKRRLSESFVHLGLGASCVAQLPFSGIDWYDAYGARHAADGRKGRLVSQHTFTEDWGLWEMHPHGDEVVICSASAMALTQEWPDGRRETVTLEAGDYAINEPGVWHIPDIEEHATAIFITAGDGTQMRPR